MRILVLNGPNLNMLGKRNPQIYGQLTLEELNNFIEKAFKTSEIELTFRQTNHEGTIIDWLQEGVWSGVVLNAGGYSHTSISIRDAIETMDAPVVEVHISDIDNREEFRKKSVLTQVCLAKLCKDGYKSYLEAITLLANHARINKNE